MSSLLSSRRLGDRHLEPLALHASDRARRPLAAIGSLAIVLLSATVFAMVYSHAGHQQSILVVTRDVPQGALLQSADLGVARLSYSPALAPIPASDLLNIVGRRTSVPLMAGNLLETDDLAGGPAVPRGEAVVGIAVDAAQLPAEGVAPGDAVNVVFTGQLDASDAGSQQLPSDSSNGTSPPVAAGGVMASDVTVTAIEPDGSNPGSFVVSVGVPSVLASLVAEASAAGEAAIVLVGGTAR
jgi:SAF domain